MRQVIVWEICGRRCRKSQQDIVCFEVTCTQSFQSECSRLRTVVEFLMAFAFQASFKYFAKVLC